MMTSITWRSKIFMIVPVGNVDEEIVIARHGRPVARLTRLAASRPGKRIGVAKGRFEVHDSIEADNEAVARLFHGSRWSTRAAIAAALR